MCAHNHLFIITSAEDWMFPPVHTGIFIICKGSFPRLFWTRQGVSWPDYESVFSITRPCSETCHSPPQLLPLPVPPQPDNCPVSAVPVGGARVLWSLVWRPDRAAPGMSCSKWGQGPSAMDLGRLSGWEERALWWVHWIGLKFWGIQVSEPFIPKPSFSPGHTHTPG